MLRALLVVLILANLAFFAYTQGALDGLLGDREPERPQVRPQSIRLLPSAPAAPATNVAATAEAATCFETPVFAAAEAAAVEGVLAASLPAGAWTDVRGERGIGTRSETTHLYRVANADAALAAKLPSLRLDASGRGFSACAKSDRPR